MTAFDHFQTATCLISEGNRDEAARELERAIAAIDRTGGDAEIRPDLVVLRDSLQAA